MQLENKIKDVIISVVNLLADYPDCIKFNNFETERNILIEVYVHPDDVGRLLGKGGEIAKSIRRIAFYAAHRNNKKLRIMFIGNQKEKEKENV